MSVGEQFSDTDSDTTGNRNELTLWTPFVEAHPRRDVYGAGAETTIGHGVGGTVLGRVSRAQRLVLGPLAIEAPVVTVPSRRDGITAMRGVAGNIGGGLLRRFVVSFDYAGGVVHLAPAGAA